MKRAIRVKSLFANVCIREISDTVVKGGVSSRCQYQPACFSSASKLSGTACLVGGGVGDSPLKLGTFERGHFFPSSSPVALLFHTSTGSLDPFY